jgi:hypothetical protein
MLASQLAAEGSIASAAHIASAAGVSTAPIVDSLIASGQYDAAVQLTMATNPMELGFVNRNIGLAKTAAETATAFPVATSPLATMGGPNILMDFPANMIDASLGQSYNALGVGAGVPAAGGMAGYGGAGDVLASGNALTSTAPAAAANAMAGYGGAGDVLAAEAAGTGAGAGAGAAGTISGYGGAGDVLDPVTGAVISGADAAAITGAGFNLSDFAKLAKDYGVPLSALVSAVTGSRAATDAANIQAESAREARALAEKIFNEQKALQEPYRAAGITAQNQLLNLLGLSGNTAAAEYGKFARPFGMSDFQQDPGYAFRLSEGMKALEASRAARGGLLSGATGKALTRYGQEMGSQEYGNAFNRFQTERANRLNPLAGLMASGQAAAAGQAANAGNYATTAGNLTTDIGAAQAAGGIGSANAITNAMNQLARYSAAQNLPDIIRQSVYAPAIR